MLSLHIRVSQRAKTELDLQYTLVHGGAAGIATEIENNCMVEESKEKTQINIHSFQFGAVAGPTRLAHCVFRLVRIVLVGVCGVCICGTCH